MLPGIKNNTSKTFGPKILVLKFKYKPCEPSRSPCNSPGMPVSSPEMPRKSLENSRNSPKIVENSCKSGKYHWISAYFWENTWNSW